MIKILKICENRRLLSANADYLDNFLGVTGEKNATILKFQKPSKINDEEVDGFKMLAVFSNKNGSFPFDVDGDELALEQAVTECTEVNFCVQFLKENEVKWSTVPEKFFFAPTLNDSGENVFEELKKQWTAEAQRPLTILVNRVTEKVTELLNERRNKI